MSASIEAKWAHTVDALRAANERIAEHEAEITRLKTAVVEWGDAARRQAEEVARLTEENALLGRKLMIMQGEQDKLATAALPVPEGMETTAEERAVACEWEVPDELGFPDGWIAALIRDLDRALAEIKRLAAERPVASAEEKT